MGRYECDPDSGLFLPRHARRRDVAARLERPQWMAGAGFHAAGASVVDPGDPHWANVVLLASLEGVHDSTTAPVDLSPTARPLTTGGFYRISNTGSSPTNGRFGNGAATVGPSGVGSTINVSTVAHSDLVFAAGVPFTLEMWLYLTATPSGYWEVFRLGGEGAGRLVVAAGSGGLSPTTDISGKGANAFATLTTGAWQHVALQRLADNRLMSFRNGVLQFTHAATFANITIGNAINPGFRINPFYGTYANWIRITRAVERYTANFTPPPAPFPTHG